MVTTDVFEDLRQLNFGTEALHDPLQPESLVREIARYDREDAARVRDMVRARASLSAAVEGLVAIYKDVIGDHARGSVKRNGRSVRRWSPREWAFLRLYWAWGAIPIRRRAAVTNVPGLRLLIRGLKRFG